ncbi:hypothetical protein BASA83_002457 [Batrachochytrium salamandrivorans]|nr:hypothetical protein BASA83_002457 [Batrachochytrium salamandrivorans]
MLKSDLDWNEQALIHQFRAGLANEVKDMLAPSRAPQLSGQAHTARYSHRCQATLSNRQDRTAWATDRDTYCYPIRALAGVAPNRRTPSNHDGRRCNSPSTTPPAEREHRFRNGLCLVCGTQGHLKATCPSRRQVASSQETVLGNPPINPDRTTVTTTTSENYLSTPYHTGTRLAGTPQPTSRLGNAESNLLIILLLDPCLPETHQEPSYQESTRTTSHKLPYHQASMVILGKLTDQVYPYIGSSDSASGNFPTCLIKEFSKVFDKTAAQALPGTL